MDTEARERWDVDLTAPLTVIEPVKPVQRVSEQVAEVEGAAFMAAMAMNQQVAGG